MNKQKLYRYIYVGIIFLFIYIPFIKLGSHTLYLPYLFPFGCTLIFFYIIFRNNSISRIFLNFVLFYWLGAIWIYLVSLYNQQLDGPILINYIVGSFIVFSAYPIVRVLSNKITGDNTDFIIRAVYLVGLIHAFIMILAFFVPVFRTILYSIVPLGENGESFVDKMIRSPGLTTGGGDSLSVIQALALIFGIYYFAVIKRKTNIFQSLLYLFSFVILVLSILLSARTGLVIFLAFLIYLFAYRFLRFIMRLNVNKIFVSKIFYFIIIFSIILPIGYNYLMNSEYSRFAKRAFEFYINYTENGTASSSSTESLKQMYILPHKLPHLIFGDGNFGRNKTLPVVKSDVGYVRMIYGVGIIGTIIMLLPLFYALLIAFKFYKVKRHLSILTIITIVVIFIVNVKVFYYFEFRESFKVLFLLIVSLTAVKAKKVIGSTDEIPKQIV